METDTCSWVSIVTSILLIEMWIQHHSNQNPRCFLAPGSVLAGSQELNPGTPRQDMGILITRLNTHTLSSSPAKFILKCIFSPLTQNIRSEYISVLLILQGLHYVLKFRSPSPFSLPVFLGQVFMGTLDSVYWVKKKVHTCIELIIKIQFN